MTKENNILTATRDILPAMPSKKTKFAELLDWIKTERGLGLRRLAERSGGAFGHNTLSWLARQPHPNPELDTIHGLAKAARIPEQMIVDACLGRPFVRGEELTDADVRLILREYESLRKQNRTDVIEFTFNTLRQLVNEALEEQDRERQKNAKP